MSLSSVCFSWAISARAWTCSWKLGRVPEAAFMARTYSPSRVSEIVQLWKSDLGKINKKAAEALADPAEFANLFPNFLTKL